MRLTVIVILVLACALPGTASADPDRGDLIDVTITNPCSGEDVLVSGYDQIDGSDPRSARRIHLTGTGLTTGARYSFLRSSMHVLQSDGGVQMHKQVITERIISAGDLSQNWIRTETRISLILPSGEVVVSGEGDSKCVGGGAST